MLQYIVFTFRFFFSIHLIRLSIYFIAYCAKNAMFKNIVCHRMFNLSFFTFLRSSVHESSIRAQTVIDFGKKRTLTILHFAGYVCATALYLTRDCGQAI
jgi:hypothetical protein